MKNVLILTAFVLLSACTEKAEATYTVEELLTDQGMLSRILDKCRNNPGELRNTVNCMNAEAANSKLRFQNMRKALGG
ncbi:EexN family lipoprotein [Brucella anthropi]|uniref:EexN family lipoprotein n=1 Tax=Brucella anthropi TaxID=529 RepID=A0A6L3Z1F3_BRUAN|nr:EexN family lipoprotein [Brucella anthropi]KAB2765597.1 EexN family lipoprotein [Brucella anthropi]KAB2774169.1 EexN family lipoprotein [Brucella anthropi]